MVVAIRNIEQAIGGSGVKEPSTSEIANIGVVRRSLHYTRSLPVGHVIQNQDLKAVRPGTGINPMLVDQVIGKTLLKEVNSNQIATIEDFK